MTTLSRMVLAGLLVAMSVAITVAIALSPESRCTPEDHQNAYVGGVVLEEGCK